MTCPTRRKAFAYIMSRDRLLVFSHPLSLEAGIQVPAGTMKDGESPEAAVLREAREETGLTSLTLVTLLGRQRFDARPFGREEIHDRWFFYLTCDQETPARWRHGELDPLDRSGEVIPFDLFWADLPHGVPPLIAGHDRFLPALARALGLDDAETE